MAYERDSFHSVGPGSHMLGSVVEYNAGRREDPSGGWRWYVFAVLLAAAAASFVYARFISTERRPVTSQPEERPGAAAVRMAETPRSAASSAEASSASNASIRVTVPEVTVPDAVSRPQRVRALLQLLKDAEKQGNASLAVEAIQKLRTEPSAADLDDKLARRLGALNIMRLFSGEPVPWVAETVVRRGQSVHRIAREHGTTVAAVRRLNRLDAREEPASGRRLRVLEFQKAVIIVHKQTKYADLSLNGRFFRRYYVTVRPETPPGAHPITSKPEEGPRSRFAQLGIRIAEDDMLELDMFLAPGAMLAIAEM